MSGTKRRTTRQLFKEWRSGDAQAGQLMAQQVADWYYAIATSRLGEKRGRKPCDAACVAFGQGVVDITESRKLVPWAHSLIVEQLVDNYVRARYPQLAIDALRHGRASGAASARRLLGDATATTSAIWACYASTSTCTRHGG